MSALPTYGSTSNPRKHTKRRSWTSFVVILAVALVSVAVVVAEAQARPSSEWFPRPVLMKGERVLQNGRFVYGTWHWYEAGERVTVFADGIGGFPRADSVRAGSRLHIRLNKPQRPEIYRIIAYTRVDRYGSPDYGDGKRLRHTFRRVERDGRTVAWDVFFRVNRLDGWNVFYRHYYLETFGRWKGVPGTRIDYGRGSWTFHVKAR